MELFVIIGGFIALCAVWAHEMIQTYKTKKMIEEEEKR